MRELENGYHAVPAGKTAAVVTYLEMHSPADLSAFTLPDGYEMRRMATPDVEAFRQAFRAVGQQWLWFSRLRLTTEELRARLSDPATGVFFLQSGDGALQGLVELDRGGFPDVEIRLFGLTPDATGRKIGPAMMRFVCDHVWGVGAKRLWLHTCTLDHPRALAFYRKCGFTAYKRGIEIADDPRLIGVLPRDAAADVPLI